MEMEARNTTRKDATASEPYNKMKKTVRKLKWSESEELFLRDAYSKAILTAKDIGEFLNGRSRNAIWEKAHALGIKYGEQQTHAGTMFSEQSNVDSFENPNISAFVVNYYLKLKKQKWLKRSS